MGEIGQAYGAAGCVPLLGEVHGVRENPLLARALMQVFGLRRLALEWPEDLAPVTEAFQATGTLEDHWLLWAGDGRMTAGHLAVLAERDARVRGRGAMTRVSARLPRGTAPPHWPGSARAH